MSPEENDMAPTPVSVAGACARPTIEPALRPMFAARKRVFVDLLGWDVPVLDGRFEVDQFDDDHAEYLVVADADGRHLASARLLLTTRPHILDSLFPELCAGDIPRGPKVREITRFCLDPSVGAVVRRNARNVLVSALVAHALAQGIERYTGVAELAWLQQILAFGWRCRPLGLPRAAGAGMIGALAIEIAEDTQSLLAANGIHRATALCPITEPAAEPARALETA
jgi:acyl-homoserine lactone synthase